jgi:hypothetical protein
MLRYTTIVVFPTLLAAQTAAGPASAVETITARLVRLIFHLGTAVATQTERPRWTAESYRQIVDRK